MDPLGHADASGGSLPDGTLAGLRALVVEHDPAEQRNFADWLGARGMTVSIASSFAAGCTSLALGSFDVLVIDQDLPDGDGFALLIGEPPRPERRRVATVGASERFDTTTQLRLLERGGVALPKPFSRDDLVTAVGLACAWAGIRVPTCRVRLGRWQLDAESRTMRSLDRIVSLNEGETAILRYLAEKFPNWVPTTEFAGRACNRPDPDGRGRNLVWNHLSTLRRKLGQGELDRLVEHVGGKGYRLRR